MSLSNTQKRVVEQALTRATTGPTFSLSGYGIEAEKHFEQRARIWAESWIAAALRAVLRNDAGELSAAELRAEARLTSPPLAHRATDHRS
jgi:hypothetical protein